MIFVFFSSSFLRQQLKYFDDPVAQCMQSLDSLESRDLSQKCEFFTRLAQTIPVFPKVSHIPAAAAAVAAIPILNFVNVQITIVQPVAYVSIWRPEPLCLPLSVGLSFCMLLSVGALSQRPP